MSEVPLYRHICCTWPIYKRSAGSAVVEYPEPGAYLLLSGRATLSLDGQVVLVRP